MDRILDWECLSPADRCRSIQLVLLLEYATDFGGLNEKAGQSKLLATASVWESRTPFVLTRHLT